MGSKLWAQVSSPIIIARGSPLFCPVWYGCKSSVPISFLSLCVFLSAFVASNEQFSKRHYTDCTSGQDGGQFIWFYVTVGACLFTNPVDFVCHHCSTSATTLRFVYEVLFLLFHLLYYILRIYKSIRMRSSFTTH